MPRASLPPRRRAGRLRGHLLGAAYQQRRLLRHLHSANQIADEVIHYHKLLAYHLCGFSTTPRRPHSWCLRDLRAGCVLKLGGQGEGTLPGETQVTVGEPSWKRLERESVEALV